ncbi:MAG: hypothetical protein WKF50_05725 [Nocardioides sp.]
MRAVRSLTYLLATAALVAGLAGCTESKGVLNDEATCPGETCTDDAQARLDAIAALDGVTGVEQVSRVSGLDRGAFHSAVLTADVNGPDEARSLAVVVLRELDAWPGHDPVSAEATVVADPPRTVTGAARESEELPPYYDPCADPGCRDEVEEFREQLAAELEGISDLDVRVAGDLLLVSGRAEPEVATLAARGTLRVLGDGAVALADRVEVRFAYRSRLEVTLRLSDGLVCEQPPGEAVVSCVSGNSDPFPQ